MCIHDRKSLGYLIHLETVHTHRYDHSAKSAAALKTDRCHRYPTMRTTSSHPSSALSSFFKIPSAADACSSFSNCCIVRLDQKMLAVALHGPSRSIESLRYKLLPSSCSPSCTEDEAWRVAYSRGFDRDEKYMKGHKASDCSEHPHLQNRLWERLPASLIHWAKKQMTQFLLRRT